MASPGGPIIILDEDEDQEDAVEAAAPSQPPGREAPLAPPRGGQKGPGPGKDPASLRAENERLFAEFVAFCSRHTADHPEVIPYLSGRHQKAAPAFLSSVEFCNVLGRCLARVQARSTKVYVYINELCTVLRAHSQKKKQPPLPAPAPEAPGSSAAPEAPALGPPKAPAEGARRQIRYLENLLRLHEAEIRRLQERELDLEELDSEDSTYLQESRLKRRMVRIFKRLCQLKDCNSRTGRVIEQRIPYRGTRYPEVNRRIERLINRPEAFPDYADIFKAVQKASARHSLALPKRQMESMAAEAFREVGNRLQERRHLDLVYNFGSHLTDQYRPNSDPALSDPELARRLRQNRETALRRLEEVTCHFAQLQERSEDEGQRRRREAQGGSTGRGEARPSNGPQCQPEGDSLSPREGSPRLRGTSGGTEEEEDDEEEEEEEEDEEEESSSESDLEAELQKNLEEEEEGAAPDDDPPEQEVEADQCMELGAPELVPSSSEEEAGGGDTIGHQAEGRPGEEWGGRAPADPPPALRGASPSQQFLLDIEEALTLEAGETPPPTPSPPCQTHGEASPVLVPRQKPQNPQRPPAKRSQVRDNGSLCGAGGRSLLHGVNGQPLTKRSRRESNSCIEVPSSGEEEEEEEERSRGGKEGLLALPPSSGSPAPLADSTCCVDSPGVGLVSSSQGSPQSPQNRGRLLAAIWKASVATQCDPEEIIVLSDSD